MALTSADRRPEDVGITTVIIPELKFRDVERQIFFADFVECADYATFEDGPETLNRVGVNRTNNILLALVVDCNARIFVQAFVHAAFISRQQAHAIGNHLANECLRVDAVYVVENAGDHIPLALRSADDRSFPRAAAATTVALFAPMAVVIFAADPRFVNFNNTAKLVHVLLDKGQANFVRHQPSGLDRTEAHVAVKLPRAHSLFAGEHQMRDLEPVAQRLVRVLKDGPGDHRKAIAGRTARSAFGALPVPFARREVIDGGIAATRAADALRPAAHHQVGLRRIVVTDWESPVKLGCGKLVNRFRSPRCHRNISLIADKRENIWPFQLCQVRVHRRPERRRH